MRRWRFFVAAVMAWWLVLPLAAQAASDQSRLEGAFAAADKGDWRAAMALAEQIKDPVARKLVQWRYYTMQDSGATFTEIAQFLTANGSWPQTLTMQRNAERAIPASLSPDQVIDWFSTRRAESARGKLRSARPISRRAIGRRARASFRKPGSRAISARPRNGRSSNATRAF